MTKSRILALVLCVALVLGCASALAENATDENICTYTVYNVTGEKVVELYLIDNASGEKGENYAGEEGLAVEAFVEIKGENYEGYEKTLAFKTESGYEASFPTLHFETVPISLLPEGDGVDTVTGATKINFFVPIYTAHYNLVNKTGETVTRVFFTNNITGDVIEAWDEADGITELADGESFTSIINCEADKTGKEFFELTLTFVTAGGYEASFPTLHFENVTIELLAQDALTGPTVIKFQH